MALQRPRKFHRRLFWTSWPIITLVSALPLGYLGFAFSLYRQPETLRDWSIFLQGCAAGALWAQVWALPLAMLLAWMWTPPVHNSGASVEQRCSRCGYGLTGNMSGRCPECGQDIPPQIVRPIAAEVDTSRLWRARVVYAMALAGIVTFWYFWFWR